MRLIRRHSQEFQEPARTGWKWFGETALSGLLLRLAGAVFNLIAIPIAMSALGSEKFAAAGALLGFAAWLTIGSGGLGSATTMLIAADHRLDDAKRNLIWQGATAGFIGSFIWCCGLAAMVPALAVKILPDASAEVVGDFRVASYCCLFALGLSAASTSFEGAYAGQLRTSYCNFVRLGWQVVAIIAMIVASRFVSSILAISLLLVLGPVAASGWFLVKGIRDFPMPAEFRFSPRRSYPLLVQGSGFLVSSLAILFYGGGSLPLFAIAFGTAELATATVVARIVQLYCSMLFVVLLPLSVALRRSHASMHGAGAGQSMALAGGAVAAGAFALVCAILLFGEQAINLWVGAPLPALTSWLLPLATLIVALSWCATWSYLAQAIRGSLLGAKLAVIEIVAASLIYLAAGKYLAASYSLYVLSATMLVCSGTVLPLIVGRDLVAFFRKDRALGR